jgi:hypothetical protein
MSDDSSPRSRSSRWLVLLVLLWGALGARLLVAMLRHESLQGGGLSLAILAFVVTAAVLGSRVWQLIDDWRVSHRKRLAESSI